VTNGPTERRLRYREPQPDGRVAKYVALAPGLPEAPRYPFYGRLEIGRDEDARVEELGLLLVPDPTVSRQHCIVTQASNGRCFVRDVSRNGTRLDGRRLVPNVETEWRVGQGIAVGNHEFVLIGDEADSVAPEGELSTSTVAQTSRCIVTVLVGDIRDYTGLVRRALSEDLQRSVSRVFETLSAEVIRHGGTVKEYQGDAILAYWEGDASGKQALCACRAALALDETAQRIAGDRSIWAIDDVPLHLDWALSTGLVLIDSYGRGASGGGLQPAGLSMMGEPVVRAFRMEKVATEETGRILACNMTRDLVVGTFEFRDLGLMTAKGFDRPDRVFALVGERAGTVKVPVIRE
jgi:adenylate cyclase